ncbi:hypothetical protein [Streptomyces sp. NPDC059389]|uniref:hypothetical protein n=1 Tax=Streptomyces sp. NPDC059389 TaxID=3346818 RepID=UPI00369D984A
MSTLLDEMEPEALQALPAYTHRVDIPAGTRIFKERQRAERFWIIGIVASPHSDVSPPTHREDQP